MTDPTPEAYEAAARAVAAETPARKHGQLCPRARSPLADIGLCDCWILPNARHDSRFAIAAVYPIVEREVRAKVAAEIRSCIAGFKGDRFERHPLIAGAEVAAQVAEHGLAAKIAEGGTE